jgi:hypothetical protein
MNLAGTGNKLVERGSRFQKFQWKRKDFFDHEGRREGRKVGYV